MATDNNQQPETILHLSKEGADLGEFHGELEDFLKFAIVQGIEEQLDGMNVAREVNTLHSTRRATSMSNKESKTLQPLPPHQDMSAFCQTCIHPQDVTNILTLLGFSLAFQMKPDDQQAYMQLKPLPAQFHYEGPYGMNVVYLAGEDINTGDEDVFPVHASRFWLYRAGETDLIFQQAIDVLTTAFSLSWEPLTLNIVPSLQEVA